MQAMFTEGSVYKIVLCMAVWQAEDQTSNKKSSYCFLLVHMSCLRTCSEVVLTC